MDKAQLKNLTGPTLAHYDKTAASFWHGTHDHDVSQNIDALLGALTGPAPYTILDFGCGPGRDLMAFKARGHSPVGLEGAMEFVTMARRHGGCDVWHQNFLQLDLPDAHFDGVFANASLFHVPRAELPRMLSELCATLKPGGVLFSSNPRGDNTEGYNGPRFGSYHDYEAWHGFVTGAGFTPISHYYRPEGRPRAEQPWLASLWRKVE